MVIRPPGFGQTRAEQQREKTRDAVVATALRLFTERGYVAVRVEDIAAEAGISRATFYKYFSEREQILGELFARLLGREPAPPPPGQPADVEGRVRTLLVAAARQMAGQEVLARFIYTLPVRHAALAGEGARPPVIVTVEQLLREAAGAGALRTDIPPADLAGHLARSFEAAMRDWAEGRAPDAADRVAVLVGLAFHGMLPPG
ncbi:MAG: TetR/AcrR family transcriptional regulator [Gemmatimonadota bacterium]